VASRAVRDALVVAVAAGALLVAYGVRTRQGPALADEFVYLAGARALVTAHTLDARYYDADAILRAGHPHHDVHAPGYVLVLAAAALLMGPGNAAAVALNVAAYVAAALLVYALARGLEVEAPRARLAALLALVLPGALPYVYWAMAETVLGALVLGALVLAARAEERPWPAAAAGAVLGMAMLVRESALFLLPALVLLLRGRARRAAAFAFVAFLLLVYAPLARHRAPGGANFWAPSSGRAFGYAAVQAMGAGRLATAAALAAHRAATNLAELVSPSTTWTERGVLAAFVVLPALALARWRAHSPRGRRYLVGLLAGYVAIGALLFGVYVVAQWSGWRYAVVLIPAFLPLVVPRGRARWPVMAGLALASVVLLAGMRQVFNAYKASRQKRQAGIAGYVERYVPQAPERLVLPNGWLYGWRHPSTEVISTLPSDAAALRALERSVAFSVLVVPADSPLRADTEGRLRYERVNTDDRDPPLVIFRRLR